MLELARFLVGGGMHRTERLTNIWLQQTDTEGGTHWTERLTSIDMVGEGIRQTQRGGTHRTERLTNIDMVDF